MIRRVAALADMRGDAVGLAAVPAGVEASSEVRADALVEPLRRPPAPAEVIAHAESLRFPG